MFLNAFDFVIKIVDKVLCPILLQVIVTKLSSKVFAVIQHRKIVKWETLKKYIEDTLCATHTSGYFQLEVAIT